MGRAGFNLEVVGDGDAALDDRIANDAVPGLVALLHPGDGILEILDLRVLVVMQEGRPCDQQQSHGQRGLRSTCR